MHLHVHWEVRIQGMSMHMHMMILQHPLVFESNHRYEVCCASLEYRESI
jgi:hypothetical protein